MGIVITDDKHYKDIAEKIKEYDGMDWPNGIQPKDMAVGVEYVFQIGRNAGYTDAEIDETLAREEGIKLGKQQATDAFWDVLQSNGEEEINYYYAFAYGRFTDDNYNPKHDIVCATDTTTSCRYVFYNSNQITDTKVDIYANGRDAAYMFYGCTNLKTIRKFVVHDVLTFNNTFSNCNSLEDITVEGVIGSSFDVHWSPLTRESLVSIAGALSPTATATLTVKKSAVEAAFPNRSEWDALFENKPTWTISEV